MIIRSLLDTDLYKFTMMQVVLHHFPGAQVEYRFKCRNPDIDLTPYVDEIRDEIRALCSLHFAPDELASNRLQDILMEEIRPGRSGNEILASARKRMSGDGIDGTIYSHPIGLHGHGAGPLTRSVRGSFDLYGPK